MSYRNKLVCFPLFLFSIVASNATHAQDRVDRPIQLQANFFGAFLSVAGNTLADSTVDELEVNKWRPGFTIGYHLNRYVYLGYSLYPSLSLTLKEEWGFADVRDGNIVLDHETGAIHSVESRISPFKFGLYLSLAYMHARKTEYFMEFRRQSEAMLIGDNSYKTDLDVKWNSEVVNHAGLGLGYNLVLKSGVSFNLGLSVPLRFPDYEAVQMNPVNGTSEIRASDLEKAESRLNDEVFYAPFVLYFSVGYNFRAR